jgi:heat shock protein HtpX
MYSEITANKRKTVIMMVLFVLVIAALGWMFSLWWGKPAITPYVLVGCLVYVAISYFASSKMAMTMNGAKQIAKQDNPRLWRTIENLSIANGMPMPQVYVIPDPAPNAFATGRDPNHAIVGVTSGLLDIMDDNELEGVVAHELGHVKNYDIRVSLLAFALVAVVSIMSDIILRMTIFGGRDNDDNNGGGSAVFLVLGLVAAILAPLAATLIQLSISRKREYLADATGALTTRYPEGLASALEKIAQAGSTLRRQNPSTAHLFFANPLKKKSFSGLFSTHPPVADRVARLRQMIDHQ